MSYSCPRCSPPPYDRQLAGRPLCLSCAAAVAEQLDLGPEPSPPEDAPPASGVRATVDARGEDPFAATQVPEGEAPRRGVPLPALGAWGPDEAPTKDQCPLARKETP